MEFDIYCDESYPDLFASTKSSRQFMVIGGLWLPTEKRPLFKDEIHQLRNKHKIGGEFKWQKISPSRLEFYKELIEWFIVKDLDLRFRCIAIEKSQVNLVPFHENDQELGFYKFYYQLLHHWILDCNEYSIFCDYKSNRLNNRLSVLQKCLSYSNLSSTISNVQATRSEESVLIQLADILTSAAAARLNDCVRSGSAKETMLHTLEKELGPIKPTPKKVQKFNVFKINLQGGW